jgi:hypothetical protein
MKNLLYDGGDWTDDEMRSQLARSAIGNGWDEPGIEEYNHYDEVKPSNSTREQF